MTDLDVYQPASGELGRELGQLAMTPDQAKALDEQVRACTKAVLREGVDYGHIPGTSGEEKSLYRPGAQKLLQWFRLECICERVDIERDDDGRKHGITYRAEVGRGLKTATPVILATCEGTADYDESKFHQAAEQVKAKLRDAEHKWAAKDRRVPNADRWNSAKEYRADWNALMKRAQKRAIVGAVVDATAAGGIFTDREEDDSRPAAASEPDGLAWYEQALQEAYDFTAVEAGRELYVEAQTAYRESACSRRQMDHIQNIIRKRVDQLKKATAVVDAEDLAKAAGDQIAAEEAAGSPENQPGSVTAAQLTKLHTVLTGLGFNGEDREQKLVIAEVITGHDPLTGPEEGRTSKNLSLNEARKLIDTLDGFADRDALITYMAEHEDYVRQETSEGGGAA
jgi:hypothetical protein